MSHDNYLLNDQKAVESDITTNTVLIGDDTELPILLIYHTNLKSHDLFFHPEPKKITTKYMSGTSRFSNSCWVQVCALTSSSCMRCLVVKRMW